LEPWRCWFQLQSADPCPSDFTSQEQWEAHLRQEHRFPSESGGTCPHCQKHYGPDTILAHVANHDEAEAIAKSGVANFMWKSEDCFSMRYCYEALDGLSTPAFVPLIPHASEPEPKPPPLVTQSGELSQPSVEPNTFKCLTCGKPKRSQNELKQVDRPL
jgi:hypothetical protein